LRADEIDDVVLDGEAEDDGGFGGRELVAPPASTLDVLTVSPGAMRSTGAAREVK
jgi:hypothetical protein